MDDKWNDLTNSVQLVLDKVRSLKAFLIQYQEYELAAQVRESMEEVVRSFKERIYFEKFKEQHQLEEIEWRENGKRDR